MYVLHPLWSVRVGKGERLARKREMPFVWRRASFRCARLPRVWSARLAAVCPATSRCSRFMREAVSAAKARLLDSSSLSDAVPRGAASFFARLLLPASVGASRLRSQRRSLRSLRIPSLTSQHVALSIDAASPEAGCKGDKLARCKNREAVPWGRRLNRVRIPASRSL